MEIEFYTADMINEIQTKNEYVIVWHLCLANFKCQADDDSISIEVPIRHIRNSTIIAQMFDMDKPIMSKRDW